MNLMGKIFTLLIFFMSISFLVLALMVGASHRNWKGAAIRMQADSQQAKNMLNEAKSTTTEKEKLLASERTARAMRLAQLESKVKMFQDAVDAKEVQLRKISEISQSQLAELEQAQARIKAHDLTIKDLQVTTKKQVDDLAEQYRNVQKLTNRGFELQNKITLLTEKEGDLVADMIKQKRVLDSIGLTKDAATDIIVPKLDGLVVKVTKNGLFAVSLGTDDGLRIGHVMDVYRKNKFIGQGTVREAKQDVSALQMNPDFENGKVQEGDHVTSKF
ncbi:MAG: hypothetical protein ACI87E_003347 [Mariniblastus sp.]|jgi:hypothetical protein